MTLRIQVGGAGDNGPDYRTRLESIRRIAGEKGAGAFFLNDLANIRYLTGFTGSSAFAVIGQKRGIFITDPRYAVQARAEVPRGRFSIKVYRHRAFDAVGEAVKGLDIGTLAFEPESLTYDAYLRLRRAVRPARLKAVRGVAKTLRAVKDTFEQGLVRESARILRVGFRYVERALRPGAVERDVALEAEIRMKRKGAEALAFDTIVASGPRGALPHGVASEKKVARGELVIVDMGAVFRGYRSDLTRTYVAGRADRKKKEVYRIVKEAQSAAMDMIRDGARASDVDGAARGRIEDAGYGKYFSHSTGHGVGLDIHEGPAIGPKSKDILSEGMVITVEPGIYIPGWGGVRIEDMVIVGKEAPIAITSSPDEIVSLQ